MRAEVKQEKEEKKGEKVVYSERSYGMVSRSFYAAGRRGRERRQGRVQGRRAEPRAAEEGATARREARRGFVMAAYRRILVAVDGSTASTKGLREAIRLAQDRGREALHPARGGRVSGVRRARRLDGRRARRRPRARAARRRQARPRQSRARCAQAQNQSQGDPARNAERPGRLSDRARGEEARAPISSCSARTAGAACAAWCSAAMPSRWCAPRRCPCFSCGPESKEADHVFLHPIPWRRALRRPRLA